MDIQQFLKFTEILNVFKRTHRVVKAHDGDRLENDAEHSHQLAVLAMYVISVKKLPLNLEKVISYALVHDLVEIYAGDTDAFGTEEDKLTKHKRETEAQEKLKQEFPEFEELHKLIQEYEEKNDPESRFLSSLDKVLPVVNIYLGDRGWYHHRDMSFDELVGNKREKTKIDETGHELWNQIEKLLENEKNELFSR